MKKLGSQTSWINGISFSNKQGLPNSFGFGRAIDHRSDPNSITLNPKAMKDSGGVVTDLPLWFDRACSQTFSIGDTGNIYQIADGGDWSQVHKASDSVGNGLKYFPQDGSLLYGQNIGFGRLLDACTGSQFYDNFLDSEGGAPTNSKSLSTLSASTQYAFRADTASFSITGDLTLEAYRKPTTLPPTGNTMTLIAKWDESGTTKSYKMDIGTISDFFGDGSDGALTISSNTTEAPIDSGCSGTVATKTLTATNASFAAGQKIIIHQTRGTNAGVAQFTEIQSYTAGTITTVDPLDISFSSTGSSKAQVRVLKQYTDVTIDSGITYTAKAWDGTVGGIIGFYASGTVTVTGTITATGKGFRGGQAVTSSGTDSNTANNGYDGEGTTGASAQQTSNAFPTDLSNNGSGGGGGVQSYFTAGGGGGNGLQGDRGANIDDAGIGGDISGSNDLTTLTFGGAGGSGGTDWPSGSTSGVGGNGGGIVLLFGATVTATGSVTNNGSNGGDASIVSSTGGQNAGGGGGGAGGSILIKTQTGTLGSSLITATGGTGGAKAGTQTYGGIATGGTGAVGRIHISYSGSYTGTTSPTIDASQDSTLASGDGYSLRFSVSDDGTTEETQIWDITDLIAVDQWARWQVKWDASASTTYFYRNGVLLGTKTGTMTAIHDNGSPFSINANKNGAGTYTNLFNGLSDDDRVWNDLRTDSELLNNNDRVLTGTEANLVAYYEYESGLTDSQTSGNNDLTGAGTPTYSSDVPFSGVTTRADEDQGLTSGSFVQGYTLATTIDEGETHRQTFVPSKDPQKSIVVDIDTIGTGNWTLTVHDALNRTIATKTVATADLNTSFFEFVFDDVWRPIIGASYHFHLTSTVADGVVDTTGANDLETAYFTTHFQILVEDTYHPIETFLDFAVIGNERYLAKFEAGNTYDPHRLTFPAGFRVRTLAFWREFIAIGCWKGTTITDYDEGRIFFWDGISDTYNHSIPVPEGGVNAMFGTQDVLFIVAGYTGEILIYTGGGSAQKFNKIPKLADSEYIEVAPGAMNMWRSLVMAGVNLNTDSDTVEKGVYTIGTSNRQYQASLGFDYPLSLGQQTSSQVKVGSVFPSGQDLLVGWQNINTYGIDRISVDNDPYPSGTVESLITDLGLISKKDFPLILRSDFNPLESGHRFRVKYRPNRETTWKSSEWEDTVGATEIRLPIKERVREIEVATDIETTSSTSPKLLGTSLESENESGSRKNA